MKLLTWGSKYSFSHYVINRYYHLFQIMEESFDIDEFVDFLYAHHVDEDPELPLGFYETEGLNQIYSSFATEVDEIVKTLLSKFKDYADDFTTGRKVVLATELVIVSYLETLGGYVFRSSHLTALVDYCLGIDV